MTKRCVARALLIAGALSSSGLLGTARAEEPRAPAAPGAAAPLPPNVTSLIASLNDAAFETRERASRLLQNAGVCSEQMIVTALSDPNLETEQRVRLTAIMRDRFMKSERGAIGIKFSLTERRPAIGELLPKFPISNAGLLKPGDIFLEADGVVIPSSDQQSFNLSSRLFQAIICSHDPGETLTVKVLRPTLRPTGPAGALQLPQNAQIGGMQPPDQVPGEVLTINVPLGSRGDLERFDPQPVGGRPANYLMDDLLRRAWNVRAERLGLMPAPSEIQTGGMTLAEWMRLRNVVYPGRGGVNMASAPTRVGGEREGLQQFVATEPEAVLIQRLQRQAIMVQRVRRPLPQAMVINGELIENSDAPVTISAEPSLNASERSTAGPDDLTAALARLEQSRTELARVEADARDATNPADRRAIQTTARVLRERVGACDKEVKRLMSGDDELTNGGE